MRAFLKLSLAAVAIALLVSGSAFAGTVETGSDAKVSMNGIVWSGIGYVTGFEDAAGNAPTSSFDVNTEARINFAWTNGPFTAHWEYWMRYDIGRAQNVVGGDTNIPNDSNGDEILGWVTWSPSEAIQIDVGQLEDQSWMERAVDWDIHLGTFYQPGATPGAYKGFPEDQPGLDLTFKAGAIRAGVAVYATGTVSGTANNQSSSVASTYIPHVEFKSEGIWVSAYYESESVSSPASTTDDDNNTTYDWGSTTDVSNTMIGVVAKVNVGVGDVKVQYLGLDGDSFEEAQTDTALAFLLNVGADVASIEYDMFDAGGDTDAQTWLRVGYKMGMATNSHLQINYAMADDGNSSSSRPSVTWDTSF